MTPVRQPVHPVLTPERARIIAERFRVLGEPMRLKLLHALQGGERSVGDLVAATGAGQANVSKHLQLLYHQGFVERRKEGVTIFYRIADPHVFDLCEMVCGGIQEGLRTKQRAMKEV